MYKSFKQLVGIFSFIFASILVNNAEIINAANLVTQEVREEFASQTNETSYKIGYKYVEENGKYQYTLDHNTYDGHKYKTTYHDTLQELLDTTASNAVWVYENLNNEEELPKINLNFTQTVPLNETLTFKMPTTMFSIPGTLSYYITSSSEDGIVFNVNKENGTFSYLSSTYSSVEKATGAIVVKSGNTNVELYFYDCKIIGITNIYQTYGADVYLDNADIYFAGYDLLTTGNSISKVSNTIELGKSLGNERSGTKFEVANYSTIGIYYPKFCYQNDCDDFSTLTQAQINNYTQLVMSDEDLTTREYWVTNGVNIYNLNTITINGGITWDIGNNNQVSITNSKENEAKFILNGNVDFYDENLLEHNPQITISAGISGSIEAYNLTHSYKYKISSSTSSDGFIFVKGDATSVEKFEVSNAHFEELADPNNESAPKVATTQVIDNEDKKNLVMKFNYYKWNFSSNYNKTLSYSGYVEAGKSIKDSYYINSDGIFATQFEVFEGSTHYYFQGYYLYGVDTELGDYDSWVPTSYDQTLTYKMSPKKYYFKFDEDSLYGAAPYKEYITYEDIGSTHYFKTYFSNVDNFDETLRVLIGWSFTSDGEIIEEFIPSKNDFENVSMDSIGDWYLDLTLYARYDPKYEVIYRAHEARNYSEDVIRYVQKGHKTSTMSHIPPIREDAQFLYWYDQSNPTEPFDFDTPITESIVLKAKWRERYTLTLYSPYGGIWYKDGVEFTPNSNRYTYTYYQDEVAINADNITISREDYIFQYWYYNVESVEVEFNFEGYLTKDIVIYPKWQIEQYTVRFVSGRTSEIDKISIANPVRTIDKYSKVAPAQIEEQLEDWDFDYWREVGQLGEFDFNTQITKDITLEAVWKDVLYKINWVVKDPIDNNDIEMTAACVEDWGYFSTWKIDIPLELPSNCIEESNYPSGYVFAGWAYNKKAEANEVEKYLDTSSETKNYRNLTIYAIWAKLFTVTFDNSAINDTSRWWWCSTEIDCNDPLWFDDPNVKDALTLTQEVAKYSHAKDIYYIHYSGHEMTHWYLNENDPQTAFDFENTQITQNIRLYPYFELKDVSVMFAFDEDDEKSKENYENDNWPETQTIKYGEKFECPDVVLEYDYYTFMWWAIKGSNNEYTKFDWQSNWNREWSPTLYPVWKANEYFITYELTTPDGNNEVELTGEYTKVITIEMVGEVFDFPQENNFTNLNAKYVFTGWINENDDLGNLDGLVITDYNLKDITFVATYEIRKLTIKYDMKVEVEVGEETEYYCVEYRDIHGYYHFGGPENVGYILSEIQCDYMWWEFTKEDDELDVVNPKILYVKNGDYFVSGWKLGSTILEENYTLTYDEVLSRRGFKDEITLHPILTPSSINPTIELTNNYVTIDTKTKVYTSEATGADSEYVFLFRLTDDKIYALVDKYSNEQNGAINFEIEGVKFNPGENKLVAIYVYNQTLDFVSIDSYEDLKNYYKLKYEFKVTLNPLLIDFEDFDIPYLSYNGNEQCLTNTNMNLPKGVSVNCEPKIDAGKYTATISIDNPGYYTWQDNTTEGKTVNWEIYKAYVYYKNSAGSIEEQFAYDGEIKEVTIDMVVQQNLSEDEYEFGGTYKTSQAGWHTFTLTFTKNYMSDYVGEFSWYIDYKRIEVPFLIDGTEMKVTDSLSQSFVFDPQKKKWELSDLFDEYTLERIEENDIALGDANYIGAGNYEIKVKLGDPINYRWEYSGSIHYNPAEAKLHGDLEGTLYVYVKKLAMDRPTIYVDDNDGYSFYTYNIEREFQYDGLEHSAYVEGDLMNIYYEATSIESAKDPGVYTLAVTPKYPNDTCWNDYGECGYDVEVEQNLTFSFVIDYGYKHVFIDANLENGNIWYTLHDFEPSEVESIKFGSGNFGIETGGLEDTFELKEGNNAIYFEITWQDNNYLPAGGYINVEWDGTPIKTQNYSDILNHLTRVEEPEQDNTNNSPPSEDNTSNDNFTSDDTSDASTGCSRSEGGKAYGDLIAILSVLGLVFLKKKKLL